MGTKNLRPKLLGRKLKAIRVFLDLSQGELIQRLGFTDEIFQGNISQYELGRREPPLPVLLRYAQIAGVSLELIIDDNQILPGHFL